MHLDYVYNGSLTLETDISGYGTVVFSQKGQVHEIVSGVQIEKIWNDSAHVKIFSVGIMLYGSGPNLWRRKQYKVFCVVCLLKFAILPILFK